MVGDCGRIIGAKRILYERNVGGLNNLVVAQQQEQDTVSIQNQANSHADVSSDTVGVATPACSTTAAIIIAILLMAIMGGVGYFAFRKTIFGKLFF